MQILLQQAWGRGLRSCISSKWPGDGCAASGIWETGERKPIPEFHFGVSLMAWLFSDNLETLSLFMGTAVVKSTVKSLDPEAGNTCFVLF